jgi:hypothetical protein
LFRGGIAPHPKVITENKFSFVVAQYAMNDLIAISQCLRAERRRQLSQIEGLAQIGPGGLVGERHKPAAGHRHDQLVGGRLLSVRGYR